MLEFEMDDRVSWYRCEAKAKHEIRMHEMFRSTLKVLLRLYEVFARLSSVHYRPLALEPQLNTMYQQSTAPQRKGNPISCGGQL